MKPRQIIQDLLYYMEKKKHKANIMKLQSYLIQLSEMTLSKSDHEYFINTILKYIDLIIVVTTSKGYREQLKICRESLDILQEIITDDIRKIFIKRTIQKVLDILIEEDINSWCVKKELLKTFLSCVKSLPKDFRASVARSLPNLYLFKIFDSISTYGDYDFQLILIETVLRLYGKNSIVPKLSDLIPESQELSESFRSINSNTFDEDARSFLNILNEKVGKVFSIVCDAVYLGTKRCIEPVIGGIDGLWVDFNLSENAVSWYCLPDDSSSDGDNWNLKTFFCSDVESIEEYRAPNSSEIIIYMQLRMPCICSNRNTTELANDVKIVVSQNSNKSGTLISKILPNMFRNKFHHNTPKVSLSKKIGYKPLKISVSRRAKSDSSKTKSDVSCLTCLIDPNTSSKTMKNSHKRNSASLNSSNCEVITISDSDTLSSRSSINLLSEARAPSQIKEETQYETAEMCPLEDTLKISTNTLVLSENSPSLFPASIASRECIQILSGRCSKYSLNCTPNSFKKISSCKENELNGIRNVGSRPVSGSVQNVCGEADISCPETINTQIIGFNKGNQNDFYQNSGCLATPNEFPKPSNKISVSCSNELKSQPVTEIIGSDRIKEDVNSENSDNFETAKDSVKISANCMRSQVISPMRKKECAPWEVNSDVNDPNKDRENNFSQQSNRFDPTHDFSKPFHKISVSCSQELDSQPMMKNRDVNCSSSDNSDNFETAKDSVKISSSHMHSQASASIGKKECTALEVNSDINTLNKGRENNSSQQSDRVGSTRYFLKPFNKVSASCSQELDSQSMMKKTSGNIANRDVNCPSSENSDNFETATDSVKISASQDIASINKEEYASCEGVSSNINIPCKNTENNTFQKSDRFETTNKLPKLCEKISVNCSQESYNGLMMKRIGTSIAKEDNCHSSENLDEFETARDSPLKLPNKISTSCVCSQVIEPIKGKERALGENQLVSKYFHARFNDESLQMENRNASESQICSQLSKKSNNVDKSPGTDINDGGSPVEKHTGKILKEVLLVDIIKHIRRSQRNSEDRLICEYEGQECVLREQSVSNYFLPEFNKQGIQDSSDNETTHSQLSSTLDDLATFPEAAVDNEVAPEEEEPERTMLKEVSLIDIMEHIGRNRHNNQYFEDELREMENLDEDKENLGYFTNNQYTAAELPSIKDPNQQNEENKVENIELVKTDLDNNIRNRETPRLESACKEVKSFAKNKSKSPKRGKNKAAGKSTKKSNKIANKIRITARPLDEDFSTNVEVEKLLNEPVSTRTRRRKDIEIEPQVHYIDAELDEKTDGKDHKTSMEGSSQTDLVYVKQNEDSSSVEVKKVKVPEIKDPRGRSRKIKEQIEIQKEVNEKILLNKEVCKPIKDQASLNVKKKESNEAKSEYVKNEVIVIDFEMVKDVQEASGIPNQENNEITKALPEDCEEVHLDGGLATERPIIDSATEHSTDKLRPVKDNKPRKCKKQSNAGNAGEKKSREFFEEIINLDEEEVVNEDVQQVKEYMMTNDTVNVLASQKLSKVANGKDTDLFGDGSNSIPLRACEMVFNELKAQTAKNAEIKLPVVKKLDFSNDSDVAEGVGYSQKTDIHECCIQKPNNEIETPEDLRTMEGDAAKEKNAFEISTQEMVLSGDQIEEAAENNSCKILTQVIVPKGKQIVKDIESNICEALGEGAVPKGEKGTEEIVDIVERTPLLGEDTNRTCLDQTSTSISSRKRRKLFDTNDLSHMENITIVEDQKVKPKEEIVTALKLTYIKTTKPDKRLSLSSEEHENETTIKRNKRKVFTKKQSNKPLLNDIKECNKKPASTSTEELPSVKKRVYRKKGTIDDIRSRPKQTAKKLEKSKKLKIVNPHVAFSINRKDKASHLKKTFIDILESFREETKTSFSDIIKGNISKNVETENKKFRKNRKKQDTIKPQKLVNNTKLKKRMMADRGIRRQHEDSDQSVVSLKLIKNSRRGSSVHNTSIDDLSPITDNLVVPQEQSNKKIKIISDIQIRPKRALEEQHTSVPPKKTKVEKEGMNVTNSIMSENITPEEINNWIETGCPNYSQSISEARIIFKHCYPMFKNLVNSNCTDSEIKHIQQICSILEHYV